MKIYIGVKYDSDPGEKYKILIVVLTCVGLWILICFDLCGYALEAVAHGREGTIILNNYLIFLLLS